jgi:hypothetical protein
MRIGTFVLVLTLALGSPGTAQSEDGRRSLSDSPVRPPPMPH